MLGDATHVGVIYRFERTELLAREHRFVLRLKGRSIGALGPRQVLDPILDGSLGGPRIGGPRIRGPRILVEASGEEGRPPITSHRKKQRTAHELEGTLTGVAGKSRSQHYNHESFLFCVTSRQLLLVADVEIKNPTARHGTLAAWQPGLVAQ